MCIYIYIYIYNVEDRLNFDFSENILLKRASKKYRHRHILMSFFKTSQFSYSALVWMSHSRTRKNRIK